MRNDKLQPLTVAVCVFAAAALLLGQFTVNLAGIFADGGLYSDGVFGISAPSVFAGAITLAAVFAVLFAAARLRAGAALYVAAAAFALVLRIAFVFIWKIEPQSDFLLTYNLSELLAKTPLQSWGAALAETGTIYAGKWSAHMPFVIYQAVLMRIFGASALPVQLANAVLSAVTCLFAADTAKKISGEKAGFITLFIMAVNPLTLFFIPVLTNQHAATCFFMAALWAFYAKPIKNTYLNAALCGALTAVSHLLRPEMYVVIIAAAVIAVFEMLRDKRVLKALSKFALFAAVFFAVLFICDGLLSANKITDQSILSGNLKYKTAVGLNYETTGTWSAEDEKLIFDEEKCEAAIAERLEDPIKIISLAVKKTAYQFGSFVYTWSMKDDFVSNEIYRRLSSAVMAAAGLCAAAALIFGKNREKLFPPAVILSGYIAAFAVIEVQPRYNYLLTPIIIILAADFIRKTAE